MRPTEAVIDAKARGGGEEEGEGEEEGRKGETQT